MDELPVIDVGALRLGDLAARRALAAQVGAACRDVGFFYITGHGVAPALLDETFAAARDFFALPVTRKDNLSIRRSPHNRGYVEMEGERLAADKPGDLKEAFNIGLDLPADHPEVIAGKPFRGINVWLDLPGWRDTALNYFYECWRVGVQLHRAFALDLGLAEDFFTPRLDAPMATLRLLHYPAAHQALAEGQTGAGEHTDYGNVTLLATDGVAGLQVRRRDGTWLDAPAIPEAFVCNIGDCLMRWTNDIYVSTPHRVAPPDRERYSIAFFLDPNPDAEVAVLPGCTGPDRPAKYPPISGAAYLAARLNATYDHRRTS
jgi:isopenicillin N synthase-like dioxygenase